jgi:hypothetical protein
LVSWDSYRSPEGRWIVTAFHDGGAVGTWVFDEIGHTVHPQDESARALMGGGPSVVAENVATQASDARETVSTDSETEDEAEGSPEQTAAPRPRLVSVTSDPTATDESTTNQQEPIPDFEVPEAPAVARREKRSKGKRGRASVPSWDEILFGASKQTD